MDSVFYPTTQCEHYDIYPVPREIASSTPAYVKVGCRRCVTCQKEIAEAKQKKWRSRIREMILHYQQQGDRVVFATFTMHDDQLMDLPEFKQALSKLFNHMRVHLGRKYDTMTPAKLVKYWVVLEYGEQTNRLHAHVFFFVDKSVTWKPLWAFLQEKWTAANKAWIFHSRLVSTAAMAANYATKYAVKQIGWNRDRMMSSQFGWESFMEEVKRKWLGIAEGEDGVEVWEAYRVPDVDAKDALRILDGDVTKAVEWIDTHFQYAGVIQVDKPVLHPFAACPVRIEGDLLCEEKEGEIETLTIQPSLVFRPAGFGLQRFFQSVSGKLSQVYERARDL